MIGLDVDSVLVWASGRRADLPWRLTRDPWAILVSEAMLQQTQVTRVVPRYHQFLDRFPTPTDCAVAGVGAVVAEWAGLGYNRRAVNLHRSAVAIHAEHGGVVPDSLDALLALPGIGPYTARAVLAFAFERDVAVVDTNVGRVLARHGGARLTPAAAQALADSLVPAGAGWAWNQAMLDLGAVACMKRTPVCESCPVSGSCAWRRLGGEDPAIGSAGVSVRQSRFTGSFREGRARLLDVLRGGVAVAPAEVRAACGWLDREDGEADALRAAESLVRDGLAVRLDDGSLRLP